MDKGLMVFLAIGLGGVYFVINFIGDIQEEDDKYSNNDYKIEHQYDQYKTVDSIGQDVLDMTDAPRSTQFLAWNASSIKDEFLDFFPAFDEMRFFIKERVRGEELVSTLTTLVDDIEDKFFSGTINAEQAKRKLSSLK
jgi:hypothetical protein